MLYDPRDIATLFAARAALEGVEADELKLETLVVLAHAWHLVQTGRPLLDRPVIRGEDVPEAGVFPEPGTAADRRYRRTGFDPYLLATLPLSADTRRVLDDVWAVNKDQSGIDLAAGLVAPDAPWLELGPSEAIPDDALRRYFTELGRREAERAKLS